MPQIDGGQYLTTAGGGDAVVIQPQYLDAGNTQVVTSVEASPGSPWVGGWTQTRSIGIVRELVVLAATDSSTLGGTFTFEYSEDGATATISEARTIGDFATVRDFDLLNAGEYFRVKFEPDRALAGDSVFVTTTLRTQNDGAFVRLANQEIEEQNAALPAEFAYLKAFNQRTGKSVNIRPSPTDALRVADERIAVSQVGAARVTGVRDDISIHFFDGTHLDEAGGIVDDGSVNGTVTFDATEGRAVFAVPATAGSTAIFRSSKSAVYEPAHTIRGEQTIVVSAQPTGNGFVEWGYGDGSNSIAWRYDASGLSVIRRKNGVLEDDVAQASWNRQTCLGETGSEFVFDFAPQALDPTKNNRYAQEYEWLGVAPPDFIVVAPNKAQVTVHTIEFPNQGTGTTIPNPQLPLYVHVANDTVSGQVLSVASGSWRGGTLTDAVSLQGQQPDLDFTASKADGTVLTDTTTFGAGATRTLTSALTDANGWFDSDGWATLEVVIATDEISAANGIVIEYTDDVNVAVPVVRAAETFSFGDSDVARGYVPITRAVKLDGFRVRYTNGGTGQGSFFAQINVRVSPAGPPLNSLESQIDSTSTAQMSRSAIFATNGTAYDLIGRGTAGGLDVGIVQFEAEAPIKSLSGLTVNQSNVATVAALIITPDPDRRALSIEALTANGQKVYFGPTSAVTSGNGYELAAGAQWAADLDPTQAIYMISNSGTQRVCWAEVTV